MADLLSRKICLKKCGFLLSVIDFCPLIYSTYPICRNFRNHVMYMLPDALPGGLPKIGIPISFRIIKISVPLIYTVSS